MGQSRQRAIARPVGELVEAVASLIAEAEAEGLVEEAMARGISAAIDDFAKAPHGPDRFQDDKVAKAAATKFLRGV